MRGVLKISAVHASTGSARTVIKAGHERRTNREAQPLISPVHPEPVEACPELAEGAGGGAPIHRGGGGK